MSGDKTDDAQQQEKAKRATRATKPKWPCGLCESNVPTDGIQCDACSKWFHGDCAEFSAEEIAFMKKFQKKFKWYCRYCDKDVKDILSNFEKFKKMTIELKNIQKDMNGKLDKVLKRLDKMEEQNTPAKLNQKINQNIEKITASSVKQVDLDEQQNRENRKKNLIFFGIPETSDSGLEDRMENDFCNIAECLEGKTDIKRNEIKDMFRLGKKPENNETGTVKVRPLLVKFHEEEKLRVLKVSNDLELQVNHEIKTVFVSHDLTAKQREEVKTLRAELKRRKDGGENNLIIRGNKIVEYQFFHSNRAERSRTIWATHCANFEKQE